jgi:hypothetical protein
LREVDRGIAAGARRRRRPHAALVTAIIAMAAIVVVAIGASSGTGARPDIALAQGSAASATTSSIGSPSASDPSLAPGARVPAASDPHPSDPPSSQPPAVVGPPVSTTYQETSSRIAYRGPWSVASYAKYSDRAVLWSAEPGASASLSFTGTSVSWIGPVGPTRGRAEVLIDGRSIATVDTWSAHFVPSRVLYTARFPTDVERTLRVVVLGTAGHPLVAVDAFVVVKPGRVVTPAPVSGTGSAAPVSSPSGVATSPYGPGIGADSLANTQIGGTLCRCATSQTSYRFRATTTAALTSIRIYLVDGSGYSGGSGGRIRISINPDDGSTTHAPSATILASTTISPGNPVRIGYLPLVTFATPAKLTAGRLYHVVFRNVDPSPTVNYISVDGLWTKAATTPRQPGLKDLDWGQLVNVGTGWHSKPSFTPILDLGYANGLHAGMGYMEVWIRTARAIAGVSAVREVFTPRADVTVGAVTVRVSRSAGSGALTATLKTGAGTVLAQGQVNASAVGSNIAWVGANLSSTVTLRAGTSYQLVLTSPSGTVYSTWAIERGNNYHFAAATYFRDGHGEYTIGAGWRGFDQPGGSSGNTNADLQFLLR